MDIVNNVIEDVFLLITNSLTLPRVQVLATDRDGSSVVYTGVGGDQEMAASLELDRVTGEITITDNKILDRETKDSEHSHHPNNRPLH